MLLWSIRALFLLAVLGVAATAVAVGLEHHQPALGGGLGGAAVLIAVAVVVLDLRRREKHITAFSTVYVGLLAGLLLGWLLGNGFESVLRVSAVSLGLTEPQTASIVTVARLFLKLVACYVSISILAQTRSDFRFIIPFVEFTKQVKGGRPLVLDTSVIIDGRIADLCETRILDTRLIVPRFVLQELQGIADSSDKLKRNRGRRGLDILKKMQSNPKLDLQMHDGDAGELKPGERVRVDERLVLFAKVVGGRVVTNDFNLNKMAQLQGVDVINLNEVANSLKTVALPGEYLSVKVVKPGDQFGQGVGYLDDGTMVVVEQGRNLIGQEASVVVKTVLQTNAGRMIFALPEPRPSGAYVPVGQSGTHSPVAPQQPGPPPTIKTPDGPKS